MSSEAVLFFYAFHKSVSHMIFCDHFFHDPHIIRIVLCHQILSEILLLTLASTLALWTPSTIGNISFLLFTVTNNATKGILSSVLEMDLQGQR